MASVASGGTADRITARILFKVLRRGSGTRARYSSTSFGGTLPFAAEPRLREFACFIRVLPHDAESAAHPGARHRERDEGEGIPVGSAGGPAAPGRHSAHNAHDKAHDAARQRVLHGPIGREPRR